MKFTDIFIKRPVLATVVSLLILLFGLRAIFELPVREFPKVENTMIEITTAYPGASADLIQGFITSPIEKSVAGADGIDYMTATSTQGLSDIKVYIKLNYSPDAAFTDIMSKVAAVTNQLPKEAQQPVIIKQTGSQIALMYIGFSSDQMTPQQVTDYLSRVVQPKIETVSGVAQAQILGANIFAMRIWLNAERMAALHVTPSEVVAALNANNFQSAAGQVKGEYVAFNIHAETGLHTVADFENMVVTHSKNQLIRLRDIAKVDLASQNYDSSVSFNGSKSTFIGIFGTPSANPLTVITGVRALLPTLEKNFPPSLHAAIAYDATSYIRASIHEVLQTIAEATLIVIVVILLFLGAWRTVLIPVVTIPLSLVGVCSLMLFLGYSLNLLTLLAMVLAIGLVVDDAIVVVENIYRHIEEGATPFNAALQGAREIATPIITMTITLAAVYAPIGFLSGITGALFTEFAFTLACAVIISGVIALTLSPMMCSKLLNANLAQSRFVQMVDRSFEWVRQFYQRRLTNVLCYRPVTVVFAITVLLSCYFLYSSTSKELAPTEDQSVLFISATGPQDANLDYITKFTDEFTKIFKTLPATKSYFILNGMGAVNNVFAGILMKPWNERKTTQNELQPLAQAKLSQVAGLNAVVFPKAALPMGDRGLPVQFTLISTQGYKELYQQMQKLLADAWKSGLFLFVDSSLKFNQPQLNISINRAKAAEMGVSMQQLGDTLSASLGGNYINYFSLGGRSYQVIPQLQRRYRYNPHQVPNIYIKTDTGAMVPLSTLIHINYSIEPNSLTEFQQLNSATLSGITMPGKTLGDALTFLQNTANQILPKGISYDYEGQSRQFVQEGNALLYTFFFSIIVIFLVLAAQFESFRDPFIILISVPMSICGALIPLNLGAATINIYTQIGLITLIGLISKHGILMVDFANKLQEQENLSIVAAIQKSAGIRLRPILMTTGAMILGVAPLVFAAGAGAVSRFDIGIVISAGMFIGTLFTLFVVPTMYTFFASDRRVKVNNSSCHPAAKTVEPSTGDSNS